MRAPEGMTPLELRSYKRARGSVCPIGPPIRKLSVECVKSKNKKLNWHAEKEAGTQDIIDPNVIPGNT